MSIPDSNEQESRLLASGHEPTTKMAKMKRDISRLHVLQLSSEERALRDEQIRKEMAELN
jgi:hypothetical protein